MSAPYSPSHPLTQAVRMPDGVSPGRPAPGDGWHGSAQDRRQQVGAQRRHLGTGFGLAASPAVITALAPHGPAALWGSLAAATLLSAAVVAR